MTFTAEVAGKTAHRFRAYTSAKMLRPARAQDHIKRDAAKLPPLPEKAHIRYDVEQVALSGNVTGSTLSITPPANVSITRVTFFKGDVETEEVVGSVDVNTGGQIDIELVEPSASGLIVDE